MLGGFLWSLTAILYSAEPETCIDPECTDAPLQVAIDTVDIMTPTSAVLILTGLIGLVVLVRHEGRLGKTGVTGFLAATVGLAQLLAFWIGEATLLGDRLPWMPLLVIPGFAATFLGVLLLGVAVVRAGVLPRSSAALMMAGSLALFASIERTAAALFSVPFGIAWIAVGHLMWSWKSPSGKHVAGKHVSAPGSAA